jgi:phosphatidylglycerol---prolipoprotein diacylglyceryl transferase
VIIGGRLGYVIFYDPATYIAEPWRIPMVWEGGMAFHGGFAGVVVAGIWFCRREKIPMLSMGDLLALAVPVGLMLGRLANFVNAELWGRPTDAALGRDLPGRRGAGLCHSDLLRPPSQASCTRPRWRGCFWPSC